MLVRAAPERRIASRLPEHRAPRSHSGEDEVPADLLSRLSEKSPQPATA